MSPVNHAFTDHFDLFKWTAPTYNGPKEAVYAFEELKLKGKIVKDIFTIGYADDICEMGGMFFWNPKPVDSTAHTDLPRCATLFEPTQILFTDGTTLELLPMDRGWIRFATNSTPVGMTTGLNRSTLNANILFGDQLIGKTLQELSVTVYQESTTYYGAEALQIREPTAKVRTTYHYRLCFNQNISLCMSIKDTSIEYRLSLKEYDYDLKTSLTRAKQARLSTEQVILTPGVAPGGTMWVAPVPSQFYHTTSRPQCFILSMDDEVCSQYLGSILSRHFDLDIQERRPPMAGFDLYGSNRYTRQAMGAIVADVREKTAQLQVEYDSMTQEALIARHSTGSLSGGVRQAGTDEEKVAIIRKNMLLAIDFYQRFAERMDAILQRTTDCRFFKFVGP